ncbi:hypothetical protein JCM10213_000356 [Rhodosporidiobolus nylandii]
MSVTAYEESALSAPSLLDLPAEILEAISEDAFSGAGERTGPICRALLPFQRRQITSLSIPPDPTSSDLVPLLSSLAKLKRLTLIERRDVDKCLSTVSCPQKVQELKLEDCVLSLVELSAKAAREAMSLALSAFTSLESFSYNVPSEYSDLEWATGDWPMDFMPSSLLSLPLKRLVFGSGVFPSASELRELISSSADHLEHLTLDCHAEEVRDYDRHPAPQYRQLWSMRWSSFTRQEFEDLLDLAEDAAVFVDGATVEGAELETARAELEEEPRDQEQEEQELWDAIRAAGGWRAYYVPPPWER